jgi:hypothetical protein
MLANSFSSIRITILQVSMQSGAAFARNRCLDFIEGKFLSIKTCCMLDAGVIVTSDWIEFIAFNAVPETILCGITKSASLFSKSQKWLSKAMDDYYDQTGVLNPRVDCKDKKILYAPSCNLIIPKKALSIRFLQDIFTDAGFEDVEYCIRCQQIYGISIVLESSLKTYHHFRSLSLQNLRSRYERYGRNHRKFCALYPCYEELFSNSLALK